MIMLRNYAWLSLGLLALPAHAQNAPTAGVWEHLPALIKAGAAGFAFLAIILSYSLLRGNKKREGIIFMVVTLLASFVFLYAEFLLKTQSINQVSIVLYPNAFDHGIPPPVVEANAVGLTFDRGFERIDCDAPIDFRFRVDGLIAALKKARDERLTASILATTPGEATAVGFDDGAGVVP